MDYVLERISTSFKMLRSHKFIVLIIVFNFILNVLRLPSRSYWIDEYFTIFYTTDHFFAIGHDVHPPTYYFFMYFWFKIFPVTEFTLRFPSLVTGSLIIILTYYSSLLLFDSKRVGVLTGIMFLLNFEFNYFQQTGRNYLFIALFTILTLIYTIRYFSDESYYKYVLLFAFLTLYTHYYAVFFLFGIFVVGSIEFLYFQKSQLKEFYSKWVSLWIKATLLFTPWLLFKLISIYGRTGRYWSWIPNLNYTSISSDLSKLYYSDPFLSKVIVLSPFVLVILLQRMKTNFIKQQGEQSSTQIHSEKTHILKIWKYSVYLSIITLVAVFPPIIISTTLWPLGVSIWLTRNLSFLYYPTFLSFSLLIVLLNDILISTLNKVFSSVANGKSYTSKSFYSKLILFLRKNFLAFILIALLVSMNSIHFNSGEPDTVFDIIDPPKSVGIDYRGLGEFIVSHNNTNNTRLLSSGNPGPISLYLPSGLNSKTIKIGTIINSSSTLEIIMTEIHGNGLEEFWLIQNTRHNSQPEYETVVAFLLSIYIDLAFWNTTTSNYLEAYLFHI